MSNHTAEAPRITRAATRDMSSSERVFTRPAYLGSTIPPPSRRTLEGRPRPRTMSGAQLVSGFSHGGHIARRRYHRWRTGRVCRRSVCPQFRTVGGSRREGSHRWWYLLAARLHPRQALVAYGRGVHDGPRRRNVWGEGEGA